MKTGANGECTLFEQFLSGQQKKYYVELRRELMTDIPGYACGPVPRRLKKGSVNVITAEGGASIRGRLVTGTVIQSTTAVWPSLTLTPCCAPLSST